MRTHQTFTHAAQVMAASLLTLTGAAAHASVWTGAGANWSSDGNPGWNGTGVPNAVGAVAQFTGVMTAGSAATQDIVAGVTLDTLEYGGSSNFTRTITPTNPFTFNQDGAGAGVATISNTNTNTGTGNRLSIASGTFTLADDLLIINTGASTNTSGAITTASASNFGGSGNLRISNVSNNLSAGLIVIGGANTFTGSVLIEKGAATFANNTGMGNAANLVTLGSAGNGSATLVSTGSTTNLANPITVAAGTGGTLLLGSTSAAASNSTYSGAITLNGDLTITSSKTGGADLRFTNVISGIGSLTKIGSGPLRLSAVNTYTGDTIVDEGTLNLINTGELRFKIANGNSSNSILGDSTVNLDGILRLDISTLTATSGVWNLVSVGTLTESFGATFNLAFVGGPTFTNNGGGNYTSGDWTFETGTGDLTLIPEPASVALMAIGTALLLPIRRKR